MKVLNFGSLNIDHVYQMDHFVKSKETQSALDYHTYIGGKGLNQSVALARAGVSVYHAGKIGEDGKVLKEYLKNAGVDISLIKTSRKPSGHAIIQVANGENCIIVYGGANKDIDEDMIDEVLENFEKYDALLVQNEISSLKYLLEKAYEKEMKIICNPSPISQELLLLPLEYVDVFILNEVEIAALVDSDEKDEQKIISQLSKLYPKTEIVMTKGSEGAWVLKDDNLYHEEAISVLVRDTTCAGDTFTGYYIGSRIKKFTVEQSLKIANTAAGMSTEIQGAAPSIPLWRDVMQYKEIHNHE